MLARRQREDEDQFEVAETERKRAKKEQAARNQAEGERKGDERRGGGIRDLAPAAYGGVTGPSNYSSL